jgi:acyl transferase domain-containing protein/SAM-dependent methyltransferase
MAEHHRSSTVKRALLEIRRLRQQLQAAQSERHEPIAIVGMGCRFPGGVSDEAGYWTLLREGVDAIREMPSDRWNTAAYYDADPMTPGKMATRFGGFLDGIDGFDHAFFGITPREAASVDPQQRLVLEVAWEALEHAGISPDDVMEQPVGIFIGAGLQDYFQLLLRRPTADIDAYVASGGTLSVIAGRLAYFLGTQGPALVVDTACSSSLVAVHQACRSLRTRESHLAIVGGVSTMLLPELTVNFSQAGMLSADGRCKAFDAAADGYVRSEGCGIVILKRLADAQTDGNRILAVIRGSAVNQDGRSSGLTVPNGVAQEGVLRAALQDAGLEPAEIDYVEAHGTGTALGDPIEVLALARALGRGRTLETPLLVGSVKTNLGHLEAAAGVAGLIKVALALDRAQLPRSLHFHTPNPHVDWPALPVRVVTAHTEWPERNGCRRAGVSSLGFSGTNAHVVLESAPHGAADDVSASVAGCHALPLSARSQGALRMLATKYAERLQQDPTPAGVVCRTASTGRRHFSHRLAVVGASGEELSQRLHEWVARDGNREIGDAQAGEPRIVLAFSGQGAQYAGMGRGLYESVPVFRETIANCEKILKGTLAVPLTDVLFGADANDRMLDAASTQPALFALEYALAEVWRSWGIRPAAVVGHSLGEYVAACVAGVWTLEDGLRLVAERGRLIARLPRVGRMAAIFASSTTVRAALPPYDRRVEIAAVNSASNVVVSGDQDAVQRLCDEFKARGVQTATLNTSHAFHSPHMEPILDELERAAERVAARAPRIPLLSNVSGRPFDEDVPPSASYWRRHTRHPVLFRDAVLWLQEHELVHVIEVGPRATLCGLGRQNDPDGRTMWLPSIMGRGTDQRDLLSSLARLYSAGASIVWREVERTRGTVALPTYPFERQRHWIAAPVERLDPVSAASDEERWRQVSAAASAQADMAPLSLRVTGFTEKWSVLEDLSYAAMAATLGRLGAFGTPQESCDLQHLRERCGIVPPFERLVARWVSHLVTRGWLIESGRTLTAPASFPTAVPSELLERARREFDDYPELLRYVESCVEQLEHVLTGRSSPLDTLFPRGSTTLAEGLYERSPVARYFNAIVAAAVAAVQSSAYGRQFRVIEIGAGTGGTTSALLARLDPSRTDYVMSDIGPWFLSRAEERFASFPFVRFVQLDIEQSLETQPVAGSVYDCVVAANVLHATRNLDHVLNQIFTLLAPGGVLVALETTDHPAWMDVTTGLIAGWQRFEDRWRDDTPLLRPETWKDALSTAGFVRVDAWPSRDSATSILGQHVVVAQRPVMHSRSDEIGVGSLTRPIGRRAPEQPNVHRPADLAECTASERLEQVSHLVRAEVMRVLRLGTHEVPSMRQRLMDLGVDSLMALELRESLTRRLALPEPLPATLIFEYPSIGDIATHLCTLLEPDSTAAGNSRGHTGPSVDRLAETIADLDDDAVAALVDARLRNL